MYLQNKKLLIILSILWYYMIALNEAFEMTDVTPKRIGKKEAINNIVQSKKIREIK